MTSHDEWLLERHMERQELAFEEKKEATTERIARLKKLDNEEMTWMTAVLGLIRYRYIPVEPIKGWEQMLLDGDPMDDATELFFDAAMSYAKERNVRLPRPYPSPEALASCGHDA
tara:strand:+ start:591 stop:935 length:345 start_codon:yes stop_codon:yes gene_type:complete